MSESACGTLSAWIEMRAAENGRAEKILRTTCANLERMGNRAYFATRAAELADVLWARGKDDEAEVWLSQASELGASDDIPTQIVSRRVRAKLLARRGEFVEADRFVREAIRLSDTTDALNHQARARLDLAHVLGIAGSLGEASAAAEAAIERFERKGNAAGAEGARGVLAGFAVA
jgi:uncharacterized protein HemY